MLEVLENFLLVRDGDAETANAEVGDGFEKVRQTVDEKREIDGVHFFGGERGVVKQG